MERSCTSMLPILPTLTWADSIAFPERFLKHLNTSVVANQASELSNRLTHPKANDTVPTDMFFRPWLLNLSVRFSADSSKMDPTKIKNTHFILFSRFCNISGTIGLTEMVNLSKYAVFY